MRTTVDIDDDVLQAAKEIAEMRRKTAGQVLSDLARKGLERDQKTPRIRNGFPLLPHEPGRIVTVEMIEAALDEE
jgi:hypothetical protein